MWRFATFSQPILWAPFHPSFILFPTNAFIHTDTSAIVNRRSPMHYIIVCQGLVSSRERDLPPFLSLNSAYRSQPDLTLAFSLLIIIGSKGKKEQDTILGPRSGYSLITILDEANLKWKRVENLLPWVAIREGPKVPSWR